MQVRCGAGGLDLKTDRIPGSSFEALINLRTHTQQCRGRRALSVLALKRSPKKPSSKNRSSVPQHGQRSRNGSRPATSHNDGDDNNVLAKFGAPLGLLLGLGLVLGAGYIYKDELRGYIDYFIKVADDLGPLGLVAYGGVYTVLEIFAVPAVPLTMTAGVLFGRLPGIVVVSAASTLAATMAFLIARYAARDRIRELAEENGRFKAVDKAIGKNSFKVVTLLRLSPLLPLALSNYFYGLTSVDLGSYVAGSWLGMLPGTILYVIAGDYGRDILDNQEDMGLPLNKWQVGAGILLTVAILGYIGRLAKKALDEAEAEGEV